MKIVKNIAEYSDPIKLIMSLGMFDGVHKGHQEIIRKLKKKSKPNYLESAILTFWPHPKIFFQPKTEIKLLNTMDEKLHLLEKFGIEKVFLQEFNNDFKNISGKEFVLKILLDKLHMKHIIIGYDHFFGKNKSGNFELLKKMSIDNGFIVEETQMVLVNELAVSSTKIRDALHKGKIKMANQFLGYNYSISGKVIQGRQIGRTIGYPTANIDVDPIKLLPKNGAYIVDVLLDKYFFKGMLSIGTNPTVNGVKKTTEVHILDFDQDIYGKHITVYLRDYIDDEIKFENLEKLVERLDEYKQLTINFFKINKKVNN